MTIHVCTGKSGLGKSAAITRPLRWLCLNEPAGEEYRKWGSVETRVDAWFDDDGNTLHTLHRLRVRNFQCHEDVDITFSPLPDATNLTLIARVRSDKKNEYLARGLLLNGVYKIAKDRRVPEPIAKYLNMSSINFAGQHDLPYLLGMNRTPFDLARHMNALANMEDIDTAFSKINARVRGEQGDVKKAQEEVDRLGKEVDRYKELGELEEYMGLVAAMETDRVEGERQSKMLRDYYTQLHEIEDTQMVYRGLKEIKEEVGAVRDKVVNMRLGLDSVLAEVEDMRRKANTLERLINHIQRLYAEIEALHEEAGKEKGLLGVCPVCGSKFQEIQEGGGCVKRGEYSGE